MIKIDTKKSQRDAGSVEKPGNTEFKAPLGAMLSVFENQLGDTAEACPAGTFFGKMSLTG